MAKNETFVENEDLDESSAADTLQPGAGSSGAGDTRAVMLDTMVKLMADLGKEDLTHFYNDAIAMIGHEADSIDGGAASKNLSTIAAKPSSAKGSSPLGVKEDIDEMFGSDELSEEFREKASTIFEAVLNSRIILETARLEEEFEQAAIELEEEFEQKLQESATEMFEELSGKLDLYLDYVIEQWMEENAIAVENSLRADIAEDFMLNLRNLFAEHYINVPTDRVDVFGEMQAQLEEMKAKLSESIDEKLELEAIISEATREATLDEVSEGLAATQVEKLRTLSEGIEYTDASTYRRKLEIVKENYFAAKRPAKSTGFITEEIDGVDTDVSTGTVPAVMEKYMSAISKSASVTK